jgi:hypothetical protein
MPLEVTHDRPPSRAVQGHEPVIDTHVILRRGEAERGKRHRFHDDPDGPQREVDLYAEAATTLASMGVDTLVLDTTRATPSEVAARIADALPAPPLPSNPHPPRLTPR